MIRPTWLLALLLAPMLLRAQELQVQPTAFTAWLSFHPGASKPNSLPIWLERLETEQVRNPSGDIEKTIFRLRFRHFPGLVDELMLRVYFQDTPGAQPVFSGWSEIGTRTLAPVTLGQGLGVPSSETVNISMKTVDYVELEAPGAGASLDGALALSLQRTDAWQAVDFAAPPAVLDPFNNAQPAVTGSNDTLLFGRVRATLEPGVIALTSTANGGTAGFEFPLSSPPLLALLTFEVLNADISAPPQVSANGQALGDASIVLTDLADPAYSGTVENARPDPVYHFGGWLKCQKIIPASLLVAGTNQVIVSVPDESTPVAIRSVEVQLKYSSDMSNR